jgi:hypothetical protein
VRESGGKVFGVSGGLQGEVQLGEVASLIAASAAMDSGPVSVNALIGSFFMYQLYTCSGMKSRYFLTSFSGKYKVTA